MKFPQSELTVQITHLVAIPQNVVNKSKSSSLKYESGVIGNYFYTFCCCFLGGGGGGGGRKKMGFFCFFLGVNLTNFAKFLRSQKLKEKPCLFKLFVSIL